MKQDFDQYIKEITNKLTKTKKPFIKIKNCYYSNKEKVDDLIDFAMQKEQADSVDSKTGGRYVLGYTDDKGRTWFGGTNTGNYINEIKNDIYRYCPTETSEQYKWQIKQAEKIKKKK